MSIIIFLNLGVVVNKMQIQLSIKTKIIVFCTNGIQTDYKRQFDIAF